MVKNKLNINKINSKSLNSYSSNKLKTNFGFTLVELVVVVVILSILSTVSFISYSSYMNTARDSTRTTDMSNLIVNLKSTKQQKGTYPQLNSYFTIANTGTGYVMQGKLDEKMAITGINEIPLDPKNKVNYIYSTTNNRKNFQIGMTLENGDSPVAYIDGDYKSVTKRMFPSLILAMNGSGSLDIQTGIGGYTANRDYFVVNRGSYNLPYDFKNDLPVKTALNFDSILSQNGVKLSSASSYTSCEEIKDAGKSMGAGEYQIMTETGEIIDTTCNFDLSLLTLNEDTDLGDLGDNELLNIFAVSQTGVIDNELIDNWEFNDCNPLAMTINTSTFSGITSIPSITLSGNTIYKVPAGTYNFTGTTSSEGHINFGGDCIGLIGAGTGQTIFNWNHNGNTKKTSDGIIGVRSETVTALKNIIIGGFTLNNSKTMTGYYIGIYVDNNTSNITLKDIEVSGSLYDGFWLDNNFDNSLLSNIESKNNSRYGIQISGSSSKNKLNNISVHNNGDIGLYINGSLSLDNNINGLISNNNNGGLHIASSSNYLNNFKIFSNIGEGIYIETGTGINIVNGDIYSNTSIGINIQGTVNSKYQYYNNLNIFNNNADGLYINGGIKNNSFNNLNIYNNNGAGIYLYGGNNGFNYYNNILSGNNKYGGIELTSTSTGNLLNNFLTINNSVGFSIATNTGAYYYGNIKSINNDTNTFPAITRFLTGSFIPDLLWLTGSKTSSSITKDCTYHINPNGANYYGTNCENRGYTGSLVTPVTSFDFGANIPKQSQPVKWNGTTWQLYGTGGIDYDTSKYIGQW